LCCGGEWEAEGCTKGKHQGPSVESADGKRLLAGPQWPDRKAMLCLERKKGTTNSLFDAKMRQWRGLMSERDQVWRLLKA